MSSRCAWDGHAVPKETKESPTYGRIVTDSSWHHYADYNLESIVAAGVGPGTDWAKIQALYVNLAAWLAPADIRRRFRKIACARVSKQLNFEIEGLTDRQIGESTRRLLAPWLPGAWAQEVDRDMLAEARAKADAANMPSEFADVLIGADMRRYMTDGKMAPVLRSDHFDEFPPKRGLDLLAEAIVSYEDELWLRQEKLNRFRASLK